MLKSRQKNICFGQSYTILRNCEETHFHEHFFHLEISYCHLVWICHSRANNNKINRLRERCLRIVYNDTQSSFNELLEKDGSASIHIWNIEILATEMYKPISNLSPPVMKRVSKLNRDSHYNLRQNFTILQTFGKIGISRDREYFLPWSKKYGIYYLMIIKT